MSIALALTRIPMAAAEGHHEGPGAWPYVIGAVTLAILLALVAGVLAFGRGREHS